MEPVWFEQLKNNDFSGLQKISDVNEVWKVCFLFFPKISYFFVVRKFQFLDMPSFTKTIGLWSSY